MSQAAAHQVDHRDENHRLTALRQLLIVFAQAPAAAQPGEGPLDDPSLRQHDKARVRPFDDLDGPMEDRSGPLDQLARIAPVGPDQPKPRKAPADPFQHQPGTLAILKIAGMNHHRQDQAQGIDDQMAFAAQDLLARVIAAKPPFSVVLTLWLSMIATLGVAFLPALRRTFSRRRS